MLSSKKISQAKAKLLINYPIFGNIASKIDTLQNDDIKSFKSDGLKFEYSEKFIKNSNLAELEFALANSSIHASMAYKNRKNNRSSWLWQLSCDYAINDMLTQSGFTRPQDSNYSKRFKNMYVEQIYAELQADILRDELEYEADDIDDIKNENNQENEEEQILEEQLLESFANTKIDELFDEQTQQMQEHLKRLFEVDFNSKINWRDELKNAIELYLKDDYTFATPNKKFLHLGFYLPSAISETFNLVIAIDSSASIDEKLLSEFINEIGSLMISVEKYTIDILVCDYKIRLHKKIQNGDILDINIIGGGATDFRPVFDYVEKNLDSIKLLLYFTDLDGIFPNNAPNYDVKWITTSSITVPFGKIIKI